MNKEDVVKVMLESINADNRELCKKAGMNDAEADSQIQQSQPSLVFILSNAYDRLQEAGVLA